MEITIQEKQKAERLIKVFLDNKHLLPYANINVDKVYQGWVVDFKLSDPNKKSISLDLTKENDLFLLFVLAIVWSRTGPWENSAYFVSYLKLNNKNTEKFWKNELNVVREREEKDKAAELISNELSGLKPRKKISFRKDIYASINLLANNWRTILQKLKDSEKSHNFEIFMSFMRSIEGLGVGNNKILIKIPLILRELKCQGIYNNISGELCCVPDARVYDAAKSLGIGIPKTSNLDNLKASSRKIYRLFGDLYDLPLFAYEDLKHLFSENKIANT